MFIKKSIKLIRFFVTIKNFFLLNQNFTLNMFKLLKILGFSIIYLGFQVEWISDKVTLQWLFNVYILFNTVSYFKLKIDINICRFKNLEKLEYLERKIEKMCCNPDSLVKPQLIKRFFS